jgi:hypothetical protein
VEVRLPRPRRRTPSTTPALALATRARSGRPPAEAPPRPSPACRTRGPAPSTCTPWLVHVRRACLSAGRLPYPGWSPRPSPRSGSTSRATGLHGAPWSCTTCDVLLPQLPGLQRSIRTHLGPLRSRRLLQHHEPASSLWLAHGHGSCCSHVFGRR